jgi:hypothetical protein
VKVDPAFSWNDSCATGADFTFRVVSIPGHVLLMGGPHFYGTNNRFEFKAPVPDPKYPQYFTKDPKFVAFFGPGGAMSPLQGNFCKVLEFRPDAKIVKQDIVLERASALPVRIQDSDGKPLAGVWVAGSSPREEFPAIQCPKAECSVYELEKGKPRLLVLFHPDRKLAGTLALKGEEKSPVIAKLRPATAIKGRLLDADGKALAGVVVDLSYHQRAAWEVHQVIHRAKQIVSDANGTFTLDDLIPEQNVELSFRQVKRTFIWAAKAGEATILKLKSGECRDLGDVRLKRQQ